MINAVIIEDKSVNAKIFQAMIRSYCTTVNIVDMAGNLFIAPQEIIRCEASGSYSNFYMSSVKKIVVSMLLKKCEDLLPSELFLRVHNSHIINIQFVQQYIRGRGGHLLMQDGSRVDVAASRKQDFLDTMNAAYTTKYI